ncbi:hypothetical protein TNCV_1865891 [Trichonephila clavipes]|nr:hypothetical protein TNCV_1865891 [Trichonephila clavipes]
MDVASVSFRDLLPLNTHFMERLHTKYVVARSLVWKVEEEIDVVWKFEEYYLLRCRTCLLTVDEDYEVRQQVLVLPQNTMLLNAHLLKI